MFTWISRLLIFVFLFNIVAPELARAQQQKTTSSQQLDYKEIQKILSQQAREQLDTDAMLERLNKINNREEFIQTYSEMMIPLLRKYDETSVYKKDVPNTEKPYFDANTFTDLYQTIDAIHQLQDLYQKDKDDFGSLGRNYHIAPPQHAQSTTRVDQTNINIKMEQAEKEAALDAFIGMIEQEPETLEDWYDQTINLIDILDPLESNKTLEYELTTYAAEVLFSSLKEALRVPVPELKDMVLDLLPRAQARAYYRLEHLPEALDDKDIIIARGTLRAILFKLHQLYPQLNLEDPLTSSRVTSSKQMVVANPLPALKLTSKKGEKTSTSSPNPNPRFFESQKDIPPGWTYAGIIEIKTEWEKLPADALFVKFMDDFLHEIKSLRQFLGEEPASNFLEDVSWQVQYATKYALLLQDTDALYKIVRLLQERSSNGSPTDYGVNYFPALTAMFGVIEATLLSEKVDDELFQSIKKFLLDMVQPKNSTDVRVLAITTAANIYSILEKDGKRFDIAETPGSFLESGTSNTVPFSQAKDHDRANGKGVRVYPFTLEERDTFAKYAVDLVKSTYGKYGKSYGLETKEQIRMLQSSLTWELNRLLPLSAPGVERDAKNQPVLKRTDDGRLFNALLTSMEHNRSDEYHNPTFMWDSKGQATSIYYNPVFDELQEKSEEVAQEFVSLVGEVILWVWGLPIALSIFARVCKVLRWAGKIIIQIPRAIATARNYRTAATTIRVLSKAQKSTQAVSKLVPELSSQINAATKAMESKNFVTASKEAWKTSQELQKAAQQLLETDVVNAQKLFKAARDWEQVALKAERNIRTTSVINGAQTAAAELTGVSAQYADDAILALKIANKTEKSADWAKAAKKAGEAAEQLASTNSEVAKVFEEAASVAKGATKNSSFSRFAAKMRQIGLELKYNEPIEKLLAKQGINVNTTRMEEVVVEAEVNPGVTRLTENAGQAVKVDSKTELSLKRKFRIRKEVTRTGTNYSTGRDIQRGATPDRKGFFKRLFSKEPTRIRYEVSGFDKDLRAYQASIDAAENGLLKTETTAQKMKFLRQTNRALKDAPIQNAPLSAEQKIMLNDQIRTSSKVKQALEEGNGAFEYWKSTDGVTWEKISHEEATQMFDIFRTEPSFYEILRTEPGGDFKQAYRKMSKLFHPDKGGTKEISAQINEAWESLQKLQKGETIILKGEKISSLAEYDAFLMEQRLGKLGSEAATAAKITPEAVANAAQTTIKISEPTALANGVKLAEEELITLANVSRSNVSLGVENLVAEGMAQQYYIPVGWIPENLGSMASHFASTAFLFGKWKFIYGPTAGALQALFINLKMQEEAQKELDKINDPRVNKHWVQTQNPDMQQERSSLKRLNEIPSKSSEVKELLNQEGAIFSAPFIIPLVLSDVINVSPKKILWDYETQLQKNDAFLKYQKNIGALFLDLAENQALKETVQKEFTAIDTLINNYKGLAELEPKLALESQKIVNAMNQQKSRIIDIAQGPGTPTEKYNQIKELSEAFLNNTYLPLKQLVQFKNSYILILQEELATMYGGDPLGNIVSKNVAVVKLGEKYYQDLCDLQRKSPSHLVSRRKEEALAEQFKQELIDLRVPKGWWNGLSDEEKAEALQIDTNIMLRGVYLYHEDFLASYEVQDEDIISTQLERLDRILDEAGQRCQEIIQDPEKSISTKLSNLSDEKTKNLFWELYFWRDQTLSRIVEKQTNPENGTETPGELYQEDELY